MLTKVEEKSIEEIDSLSDISVEVTRNLATLMAEQKHLTEKLEIVLEAVNSIREHDYKIRQMDKVYDELTTTIKRLDLKIKEFDKKFIIMDEISKRRQTIFGALASNWWKILAIMAPIILGLAELIKFVYKLDPRA